MSWPTAVVDFRVLTNDGDKDKDAYKKKCLGRVDGTNASFRTFEKRRVTDFTTAVAPLGVFVNGAAVAVSADDTEFGEFTLAAAPTAGARVEASYYFRYWLDAEITVYLRQASNWLGLGDTFANIPKGLQPAALHFAAQEGYDFLSQKFIHAQSDIFILEDGPKEKKVSLVQYFLSRSKYYKEKSEKLRDDFYSGQGQSERPIFANIPGRVRSIVPKR